MRKNKVFRNVAFAAATIILAATALTTISCSCTYKRETDPDVPVEEPVLDKINLEVPQTSFEVEQGQSTISQEPVEVECFDQNGDSYAVETEFVLTINNQAAPSWISIDENNKINIDAQAEPGTYNFQLYAQDLDGKVKSNVNSLIVHVYAAPIPEPVLTSIVLVIPEKTFKVEWEVPYKSTLPLTIKCYDQYGQPIEAETEIHIESPSGSEPPPWVWVDEDLCINVDPPRVVKTYNLYMFAKAKDSSIQSGKQQITINIYDPRAGIPDSLEIETDELVPDFYPGHTDNKQYIDVHAYKDGEERPDFAKRVRWEVIDITGPKTTDIYGYPLFYIGIDIVGNDVRHYLTISPNAQDKEYYSEDYKMTVVVTSLDDEEVKTSLEFGATYGDYNFFEDEETGYGYIRRGTYSHWELFRVNSNVTEIVNPRKEIYHQVVDQIADNLTAASSKAQITNVILPDYFVRVGKKAFTNMTSLYTIAMPGVTEVDDYAFSGCTNMSLINGYDQPKLQIIGNHAFENCPWFELDHEQDAISIGDYAFTGYSGSSISLGTQLQSIGENCFKDCSNLKEIIINTEVPPTLNGPIFSGSTDIEYIKVPENSLQIYLENEQWALYRMFLIGI